MSAAGALGAAPASRTWRLLLVLGALSTFGPLSIDLYLPALPQLADELHTSDSAAQWSVSTCLIGLALGQLIAGPVSDRIGRRRPLLVGVAAYGVASLLCALSPSIGVFIALRTVQGLAGSAGIVIVDAIVRDLYEGRQMARILSLLTLIGGGAPIVAPVLGGQLLHFTDWRGLFAVLTAVSGLLWAAVLTLPETAPATRRRTADTRRMRADFADLARDRLFVGCALGSSVGGAAFFIYISVSSFVIEGTYGASPQQFSLIFAANSVGLMLGGYVNARALRKHSTERMLVVGALIAAGTAVAMVVAAALHAPIVVFLLMLFLTVTTGGLARPNATALALLRHSGNAGTAAAVIGCSGFLLGGILAPLASLGDVSAVTMAAGMAVTSVAAVTAYAYGVRPARRVRPA